MAEATAKRQLIELFGPNGSPLSQNYSYQLGEGEHTKEIVVRHGWVVDAIGFVVAKPDGVTYTIYFGGDQGDVSKIALKDDEYITKISGTYGNYMVHKTDDVNIGTLKIHTNFEPDGYGPYGQGQSQVNVQSFTSPELSKGAIVGVFGRCNNSLKSIGVYIDRWQLTEHFGPSGSQLSPNYRYQHNEGEHMKEIVVRHGWVVDAIGFMVAKPDGVTYTIYFGGEQGNVSKIALSDGEYITKISGTYGTYEVSKNNDVNIGTLKIHTNLEPDGYGPYGQGRNQTNVQSFTSPELTDGAFVGVFGRCKNTLESIGVLIKRDLSN